MQGRTLGPYEILEKLGEGGMGVLYRARDTALGRTVAVKVLPPEAAGDPERRRRFVQEAKAASALNHPNIVTIYDINRTDGAAAVDFIAMEHIEGRSLDQVIASRPLPLREALGYAVQIASALAAAHQAGIVHRDVKPGNVMVTPAGQVKVLDFGLAKLAVTVPASEDEPTRTAEPHTAAGAILGTAAYMSPEQAEGGKADARSDIFSFGSVLYEMATGRRAFQRHSTIATLSAILHEEPNPIGEALATTPAGIDQVVTRCLRKDPSRRFQHMDDLKVALEELREELDLEAGSRPLVRRVRRPSTLWGGTLLATLGVAGLAVWYRDYRAVAPDAALEAVPLTSYPGTEFNASLAPDGTQVAFASSGETHPPMAAYEAGADLDIYVKLIGPGAPLRLTSHPGRDASPAWSPDGRFIAFLRTLPGGKAGVIQIPALGGPERKLAETYSPISPYLNPAPAWSPDAKWLVVADKDSPEGPFALTVISAATGEKRRLTSPPATTLGDSSAAISPDGRSLVFVRTGSFMVSDLYRLALLDDLRADGDPARLTFDDRMTVGPAWTRDGREIVFASGDGGRLSLWRMAMSGSAPRKRLTSASEDVSAPAISRQGRRLVYTQDIFDPNIWRVQVAGPGGKAGAPASFIASTRIDSDPDYSPDGRRIAFESNRSGSYEIWVCDSDGSNAVQLTSFGGPIAAIPRWSPDAERIAFDSNAGGQFDVYVIDADGGTAQRVTTHSADDQVPSWSRDGKWIYFASKRSGEFQVWKTPAGGGDAVQVTQGGGFAPSESPDGRFLYYTKWGTGLWKAPVAGGEERRVLESLFDRFFAVTDHGVYFIEKPGGGKGASIHFFSFAAGTAKAIVSLEKPPFVGFTVSPDGRSILFTQIDQQGSDLMLVENFR